MSPRSETLQRVEHELDEAKASGRLAVCLDAEREAKLPEGLLLAVGWRDEWRLAPAELAERIHGGLSLGLTHGVAPRELLKFALSALDAGAEEALRGYHAGDSDLGTAEGSYGADVIARLLAIQEWLHPRESGSR